MKYRKLGNRKMQMSAIGPDVGFVLFSPLGKREIMKKYILGIWMVCLASLVMAQTPKAEQVMNKKQQYIVEVAIRPTNYNWQKSPYPAENDRIPLLG